MIFGYEQKKLVDLNAMNTSNEILQQPKMWRATYNLIKSQQDDIKNFIKSNLTDDTRIIFTGAGTSDYIGDTIKEFIKSCTKTQIEAIATTDIVANPNEVINEDKKTILVSFARSGNSPESIGAYNILQNYVKNIRHIVITCNKDGNLAKIAAKGTDNYIILLPEETNDKGFAMTSSFTCMMLAALLFFDIDNLKKNKEYVDILAKQGEMILEKQWKDIKMICNSNYKRVVYLGSGCFYGLAQELALKNMELTNGKIATLHETILGFRHGPKAFMDNETIVIVLMSQNEYTNSYIKDLIYEIHNDIGNHKLAVFSYCVDEEVKNMCDSYIAVDGQLLPEVYTSFNYALYGQLFGLFNSIRLGVEPDNPNPDGIVNRVVKGVVIHEYIKSEKTEEI